MRIGRKNLRWGLVALSLLTAFLCGFLWWKRGQYVAGLTGLPNVYVTKEYVGPEWWKSFVERRATRLGPNHVWLIYPFERVRSAQLMAGKDNDLAILSGNPDIHSVYVGRDDADEPGTGLETLGKIPQLRRVNIPARPFDDEAQADLTACRELRTVMIKGQGLNSLRFEILGRVPNLRGLTLWNTRADDETLRSMKSLKHLQGLRVFDELGAHRIGNHDLEWIRELTQLRVLSLKGEKITDRGLQSLSGLTDLERLTLNSAKISGTGLNAIARLPQLKILDLSQSTITDADLIQLKNCSQLERLNLSGTQITGPGLSVLKHLPNLKVLELGWTPIGDDALNILRDVKTLHTLGLSRSKITARGIGYLKELPHLSHLTLTGECSLGGAFENTSNSDLDDRIVVPLCDISTLESLTLYHTAISSTRLLEFTRLKSLRKLDILSLYIDQTSWNRMATHFPDLEPTYSRMHCTGYILPAEFGLREPGARWRVNWPHFWISREGDPVFGDD